MRRNTTNGGHFSQGDSHIYGNSIVFDRKDFFGLESNTKFGQFVAHADTVRFFQQSWPELRVDAVRGTENIVGDSLMNQMISVSSGCRFRVLRGSAFGTQRVDRS